MSERHHLEDLLNLYKRRNSPKLQSDLQAYRGLTLDVAVLHAGMAERFSIRRNRWVRHDHQRRLKRSSLQAALKRLRELPLARCASFHDLFSMIESGFRDIPGVGELMVYDTSLRIGAHFSLEPDRLYLHSGTRAGARRLGLSCKAEWVLSEELPETLRQLPPLEIEDFLCIYKEHFGE